MDVRIGVTYSPKEIDVELPDDTDRDELRSRVESAVGGEGVLWLEDRRGSIVGVPSDKIAYVELGSADRDRRVGFGA